MNGFASGQTYDVGILVILDASGDEERLDNVKVVVDGNWLTVADGEDDGVVVYPIHRVVGLIGVQVSRSGVRLLA